MTTQTTDEPRSDKQPQIIIPEFEEDEDGNCINYSDEWWKADFNYLPIHFFKKMMTRNCFELVDKQLSYRKVVDIMNNVVENITPTMIQEFHKEYTYSYQQEINTQNNSLIMTGYIDSLKEYLSKLICVYLDPTFYGNKTIFNHIQDTFNKFFSKERYWEDEEIDHLEKIIRDLPNGTKN